MLGLIFGSLNLMLNKKGSYATFADQYLKYSPLTRKILKPHLSDLINRVLEYSSEQRSRGMEFTFSDEMDLIRCIIKDCVAHYIISDLANFPRGEYMCTFPKSIIIATDFMSNNNIYWLKDE